MTTMAVGWIDRLADLVPQGSAASGPLKLSLAVTVGLIVGAIRFRGFKLGVSAVLFAALAMAQVGVSVNPQVLAFVRDLSLILFVYAIGLQVGPAFFSSFRSEGLRLNVLTLAAIGLGALLTALLAWLTLLPRASAPGLYAGAYTTTPGLAAGSDALRQLLHLQPERFAAAQAATGLAYAVSYPLGVIGPSLVIMMLQRVFKIDISAERAALVAQEESRRPPVRSLDFEVTQPAFVGQPLKDHPLFRERRVWLSRLYRDNAVTVPNADTLIQLGDIYRAVGTQPDLEEVQKAMGRPTSVDLSQISGGVQRMEIVVTRSEVLRRPLRELDFTRRTGVTIGRVSRAGIDLAPAASLTLKFGDLVIAIGPEEGMKMVETELGNSQDTLNRPQLLPIFLGIVLGVIIGAIPLRFPGLDLPMQIGLAGGPMLAAIALSQLGNIGSVIWYMPVSANQLFRDFGLAVFLACIGFESGDHFLQRTLHGGLMFVVWGALVTIVPVFVVGCLGRIYFRTNFVTLSGWVAGAMTSTPGLVFASELSLSESPSVAYATVAPLGMLAPIICSQVLAIVLVR